MRIKCRSADRPGTLSCMSCFTLAPLRWVISSWGRTPFMASHSPQWRGAVLGAYGIGGELGVTLPHSRSQELEADRIGLIYMARAGYDPRESVAFWRRFSAYQAKQGGKPIEFLSTHPLDETRIRALEDFMGQAMAEYDRARRR